VYYEDGLEPMTDKIAELATTTTPSANAVRGRAADFLELTKPRVNVLVVATTLLGYYMGATPEGTPALLLNTVIGTTLVASGASAFNQLIERDLDALMRRTRNRPLPTGRLTSLPALIFAIVLSLAGVAELAIGANLLAAAVASVTLLTYTLAYTPLKTRTSLATVVGSIPGALPPMIGWAAARNTLSIEAWTLFAIVFLWQMPHFLAIAWMYREDYKRAGFPLLPIVEPDGASTGRQALVYAAALVPVSLAPTAIGLTGGLYMAGAFVAGLVFVALAVRFARERTAPVARHLFFCSIAYLPLLWGLMVISRVR
jgi:protoheme IX farnesyltransferase